MNWKEVLAAGNRYDTPTNAPFPHEAGFMQVRPSLLGGVGVFAIRDVRKGERIYTDDPSDDIITTPEKLEQSLRTATETVKHMYHMYSAYLPNGLVCIPRSFQKMSSIWYLNHSDTPNVASDDSFNWYAVRDIKEGEEFLANYNSFDSEGFNE